MANSNSRCAYVWWSSSSGLMLMRVRLTLSGWLPVVDHSNMHFHRNLLFAWTLRLFLLLLAMHFKLDCSIDKLQCTFRDSTGNTHNLTSTFFFFMLRLAWLAAWPKLCLHLKWSWLNASPTSTSRLIFSFLLQFFTTKIKRRLTSLLAALCCRYMLLLLFDLYLWSKYLWHFYISNPLFFFLSSIVNRKEQTKTRETSAFGATQ